MKQKETQMNDFLIRLSAMAKPKSEVLRRMDDKLQPISLHLTKLFNNISPSTDKHWEKEISNLLLPVILESKKSKVPLKITDIKSKMEDAFSDVCAEVGIQYNSKQYIKMKKSFKDRDKAVDIALYKLKPDLQKILPVVSEMILNCTEDRLDREAIAKILVETVIDVRDAHRD